MDVVPDHRVLVTGGTGMVGANLVHRLVASGASVGVLSRPNSSAVRLQFIQSRIEMHRADIADGDSVKAVVKKANPNLVFHLISTPYNVPSLTAETHYRVNVLGTLNLLEALRECPGARLVFTGSAAEYGSGSRLCVDHALHPGTLLGASKAAAGLLVQTYARLYGLRTVVLRLFMIYGPWESPRRLIPHTILSALAGKDVPMSQGRQQRDFVYVDDLIDALLLAGTRPIEPGSVFNIGSGVGTPVRDVVEWVVRLVGRPVKVLAGAIPTRADEIMEMSADTTSAKEVLGWEARTSLQEGLQRAVEWFSRNREVAMKLP